MKKSTADIVAAALIACITAPVIRGLDPRNPDWIWSVRFDEQQPTG
jgi:hypothetical protein